MTDQEIIENDLRLLLAVVRGGTPLIIQASGGPTLSVHDPALCARIVGVLEAHLLTPSSLAPPAP